MSNLFKSKFIFGLVVALALVVATTASAYTFTAPTLKMGSKSQAVMELQKVLNANGYTVSSTGAGSPGYESSYFGSKTKAAVMKWQAAVGLVADGVVGPASRAVLNGTTSTTPTTTLPAGCTSTVGYSSTTGAKCDGTTSTTVNSGAVSAMLAATNPASSTLVAGQATADLLHLGFSGTGTVTNVVLKRIGVSADATPSNVYLFDGAMRLTDAASVSSNGLVTFNNAAGLFMVNGSKTVAVKSDIAASTSGQTVGFQLVSFTVTGGSATTSTLSGNIHTIASASLASVSAGTVTPSGATLNPGADVTVWQSTLTVSTRDVMMKRISLRNVGSATASAFSGFKLYVNGVQVGTASTVDANGYVTFDFMSNPVLLASGSRVVRLDAGIVSGASRTVQFSLRQAADVDFVDSSFGVNITPTSTPWASSSANTISGTSGGSLTIEKDTTSTSGNVSEGTNDKVLAVYKVTAYGEAMKIETLRAAFTSSDSSVSQLRNGRLMIGGVQYGSTSTLQEDSASPAYTSFTLNYTVMPGTPVLVELRADLYDNDGTDDLSNGDTIVGVIAAGSSNVMKVDSLGTVSAPASAVSGNTLTLADASATLTKNGTYANQNVALPATAFKIGSWNLAASSTEDILLTTLSFDVDEVAVSADDFNESDITNMYVVVKNGSTVVAQPSPLATVAAADNNFSINYTLMKNSNISIELFGNLGSTVTTGEKFKTDLTVTGTAMTSGSSVTATSADTDGQTLTAASASITATLDASAPVAAIVYDNQTVTAASFKFAAVTSAYDVTDITLTLANATVAQTVELYDGATMVASRPGASTVTFNGLTWNVPSNTNKVLTVKLVLGGVGIGAGTSGAAQTVTLTAFTAINKSTGVSAAGTESNPAGNAIYAYAATPTITNVALPSTTLTNGTTTVSKFSVASNGGTIGWKYFAFTIAKVMSGTDTLASATLWDADTNTQIAGTATFTGSVEADNDTAGGLTFVATNEQEINGTKTYVLKMTVAGATTSGDYLTVSIAAGNTSYDAPDAYADVLTDDSGSTFIWTDQSATSHSASTDDWNNDYLVKNIPTDTQVLTF